MTVVGKITKSKELVKIGGVMSLVGGIGSIATSAISAIGAAGEGAVGVAEGAAAGAAGDLAADAALGAGADAGMEAAGASLGSAATEAAATTFPVDLGGLSGGVGMLQTAAPAAATGVAPAATGSSMMNPQSATEMFNANMSAAAPAPGVTGAAFDVGSAGAVAAPADTSAFGIKKWFDGLDKATQGKVISGAVQRLVGRAEDGA
jgi:hypothetical protein